MYGRCDGGPSVVVSSKKALAAGEIYIGNFLFHHQFPSEKTKKVSALAKMRVVVVVEEKRGVSPFVDSWSYRPVSQCDGRKRC